MVKRVLQFAVALLLVVAAFSGSAQEARAQYLARFMQFSSFHNKFNETGNTEFLHTSLIWPGSRGGRNYSNSHFDNYLIGAHNIDTPDGDPGPTTVNVRQQGLYPELYEPVDFALVSKRPKPKVTVDGLETILRPGNVDEIDPNLPSDRMIRVRLNTWLGLTVEHKYYQFSHPYHEKYYVRHTTLTNTGRTPPDVGIQRDVALDSVMFYKEPTYKVNFHGGVNHSPQRWGGNTTTDIVGDGDPAKNPGGHVDALYPHQSELQDTQADAGLAQRPWVQQFSWATHVERDGFNILGGPIMTDDHWMTRSGDSTGRLSGGHFVQRLRVHADESSHAPDDGWSASRDAAAPTTDASVNSQPYATIHQNWGAPCRPHGGWNAVYRRDAPKGLCYPYGRLANDPFDASRANVSDTMTWKEWQAYSAIDGDHATTGLGYGPYNIEQGDEVDIVEAAGVAGLSRDAREQIGAQFKRLVYGEQDEFKPIKFDANGDGEYTWEHTAQTADMPWENVGEPYEVMSKQEWVMTSRDSAMQQAMRIFAVTEGGYQNFGYKNNLAEPPLPPKTFAVESGVGGISLSWSLYEGADTPDEWVIYRNNDYWNQFSELARVSGDATSYLDESAQRGVEYYYYIQAVEEDVSVNDAAVPDRSGTIDVRSNKYYSLTFTGATLLRAPPENPMEAARVVPNPFNFNQDENVRWPQQHQLGFLDIPGKCTIEIYTEVGELVKTIEHTDGSGDEYWRLNTESNQVVAPGIYYAVIKEHTDEIEGDQQVIRKFTVIR